MFKNSIVSLQKCLTRTNVRQAVTALRLHYRHSTVQINYRAISSQALANKIRQIPNFEQSEGFDVLSRVEELMEVYPLCQEALTSALINSPEILHVSPERMRRITSLLLLHGDRLIMTEEESLLLFERCPDILSVNIAHLENQITKLMISTSLFTLPWNLILIENPQLLFTDAAVIHNYCTQLSNYFKESQIYSLIGNNPTLLCQPFDIVEQKLNFLLKEMNVSVGRISVTRNSLTKDLHFYKNRYEFLNRAGLYKHPDPNQKGMKMSEATPHFTKICDTSEEEFIKQCAPRLTLEEFHVLKSLLYLEQEELNENLDAEDDNLNTEQFLRLEEEKFSGSYGKSRKTRKK